MSEDPQARQIRWLTWQLRTALWVLDELKPGCIHKNTSLAPADNPVPHMDTPDCGCDL